MPVDHPAHEPYGKRASADEKLKKYRSALKTSVSSAMILLQSIGNMAD
ncbi:MAG: hypothetical protein IKJ45_17180 [Kiritimatiellae bacterium]|nr:hypothetical protein [Kiritimatiellia bacterium]